MIRKAASIGLGGLALLIALGTVATPEVHATSMNKATVEDLTDSAHMVVRGVITEVWTETDDNGRIWTRAQLEVSHQYKGDAGAGLIVSQLGGVHHNDFSLVPGSARFSIGEEGLFFLERLGSGSVVTTGKFQGKFTVRIDPDNGREMLVRFLAPQDTVYDHRFIPHPPLDERVYMDDIEQRVLSRLETTAVEVKGDK